MVLLFRCGASVTFRQFEFLSATVAIQQIGEKKLFSKVFSALLTIFKIL